MNYGPIARIVLRYGASALVTYGFVSREAGAQIAVDTDLELLLGMGLGAAVEAVYAFAKRKGWAT